MATYTCKRCGKKFDLVGKSNYCWDCRHRTTKCVVCGKDILHSIKHTSLPDKPNYKKIRELVSEINLRVVKGIV